MGIRFYVNEVHISIIKLTLFPYYNCDFFKRHSDLMNPVRTRNVTRFWLFLFWLLFSSISFNI